MNDFELLCKEIDDVIMKELKKDPLGIALDMFNYFNSPVKPLSPREFLHFWVHLTDDDKLDYISATTKPLSAATGISTILLPGEVVTTFEGEQT